MDPAYRTLRREFDAAQLALRALVPDVDEVRTERRIDGAQDREHMAAFRRARARRNAAASALRDWLVTRHSA